MGMCAYYVEYSILFVSFQAESEQDIETHCSRSTEDKLYDCIARLKGGCSDIKIRIIIDFILTLLHLERPKLFAILAFLSVVGLRG